MSTQAMKVIRLSASFVMIASAVAMVFAQTPGGRPGGSPASTTTTTTTTTGTTSTTSTQSTEKNVQQSLQEILEEPSSPEAYHYDPQGRRDPFQSLIGPAPKLQKQNIEGPAGFPIDQIKLQGIVRTRAQGLIAVISGPDNKSYMLRVGEKVQDGEVIRITPSSVVFRQEVNDPTRIERFREVVKDLIPEESKQKK
jgi:Tfp pilus assembly protein PilP